MHILAINQFYITATIIATVRNRTAVARENRHQRQLLISHQKRFQKNIWWIANERQRSCEYRQYFRFLKCFTAKTQYIVILAYYNS